MYNGSFLFLFDKDSADRQETGNSTEKMEGVYSRRIMGSKPGARPTITFNVESFSQHSNTGFG